MFFSTFCDQALVFVCYFVRGVFVGMGVTKEHSKLPACKIYDLTLFYLAEALYGDASSRKNTYKHMPVCRCIRMGTPQVIQFAMLLSSSVHFRAVFTIRHMLLLS